MADHEDETPAVDDAVDDGTAEAAEVEGFTAINTTRSNIKKAGGMTAAGLGGVGSKSEIAIKEQGIK